RTPWRAAAKTRPRCGPARTRPFLAAREQGAMRKVLRRAVREHPAHQAADRHLQPGVADNRTHTLVRRTERVRAQQHFQARTRALARDDSDPDRLPAPDAVANRLAPTLPTRPRRAALQAPLLCVLRG